MSTVDALPPDQRAVLQLVLQRGRSYDEIASLLSIDRAAVRQRALDGLESLAPEGTEPARERALITDYLLGQLPERVAGEVGGYLSSSPVDRAWAVAVAAELSRLTSGPLPEIPVGAPLGADAAAVDEPAPTDIPASPTPAPEPVPAPTGPPEPGTAPQRPAPARNQPRRSASSDSGAQPPRGSRRGGAILLGLLGVAAVVLAVVLLTGGGSSNAPSPATDGLSTPSGTSTPSTSSTPTSQGNSTSSTSTTTTSTTTAKPKLLAALNLTSPTGAANTAGVVQVIRLGHVTGIVIDAQGMPANTAHDAYAVWLYNSATSSKLVGFVHQMVGSDGKLQTEGKLPKDAARYGQLLITLETQSHPTTPGQVVLSGPFREHP